MGKTPNEKDPLLSSVQHDGSSEREQRNIFRRHSLQKKGSAARQLLCLQFSELLLMVLDLASLVGITWWCLGSKAFVALHWLVGVGAPSWRFWGLPMILTLIKLFALMWCVFNHAHQMWRVMSYLVSFGLLVLLAMNSIALDSFSLEEEASFMILGANIANSLPVIFTVLEVVNLRYMTEPNDRNELPTNSTRDEDAKPRGISLPKMIHILKPYFWPHGVRNKVRASSTYFVLICSKLANLMSPLFMARATNALVDKDGNAALRNLIIFCALVLVSKCLKELQSVIYLRVKQTAYIELATMTYEHVHSLSYDWHVKKKLGDVLRSMDRGVESANSMVSYVFLYLVPTLAESVVVIVIFAGHFQLATLSFVAFFSLVIYAFLTIKITLWRKKFRQASTKHDNEYHDKATDALVNYETIKYFSNEQHEVDTYTKIIQKYQKYSISVQASLSVLNGSQALVIQLTILLTLALAIPHVTGTTGQRIDVGAFVAISVYLNNLFQPLSFLGSIYNMVINAVVDMQKLSELLSVEPDIRDSPDAKDLSICDHALKTGIEVCFKGVDFHYPSQSPDSGVKDLTFTIQPGTATALVGETGAGKTTISRLLFRFYDCTAGKILVNHQDVRTVKQQSLRRIIGIVPQDTVLFNDSILYNIKYGKLSATFDEVVEAAKNARIYDFIMSLPEQWNTKVGERGLKLSGGEKQRVAIARTLLKDPPFVILDEATSALDTVTEREIQAALNRLKSNRTMLIIAHRLSTVRHSQQILVLKSGKIVERGTHEDLLAQAGLYSHLWNAQLKSNEELME